MQHPWLMNAHLSLTWEGKLNNWQWKGQNLEYVIVYEDDRSFIPFTTLVIHSQVQGRHVQYRSLWYQLQQRQLALVLLGVIPSAYCGSRSNLLCIMNNQHAASPGLSFCSSQFGTMSNIHVFYFIKLLSHAILKWHSQSQYRFSLLLVFLAAVRIQ